MAGFLFLFGCNPCIKPRTYTKDGEERQVNDVDRFLDYDPSVAFTPVNDAELPWGNGGF